MPTPKSRLHDHFRNKKEQPHYSTNAVQEIPEGGAGLEIPGLVALRTVFICTITMPDGSTYTSRAFPRKKDAEQDAARIAVEKISLLSSEPLEIKLETDEEKWEALCQRIVASFADQCMLTYRPLVEHFRASIRRKADGTAEVPASVLASHNTKILSICKAIDPAAEENPARAVELVYRAAQSCRALRANSNNLCISRIEPFGCDVQNEVLAASEGHSLMQLEVVYIPSSLNKMVKTLKVDMGAYEYYMDAFAQELHCRHAGHVLISRLLGKTPASNGIRLYWQLPASLIRSIKRSTISDVLPDSTSEDDSSLGGRGEPNIGPHLSDVVQAADLNRNGNHYSPERNSRASLLTGYSVYGDAILASAGSDWRSEGNLVCNDVSLVQYYRLILMKSPRGSYKLSRNAVLAAELPTTYTTRTQWRGLLPRAILTEFCQCHHLPEPVFSLWSTGSKNSAASDATGSIVSSEGCSPIDFVCDEDSNNEKVTLEYFESSVTVQWKDGSVIKCLSESSFRSQVDAKQSASLKALLKVMELFDSNLDALGCDHPFRVMPEKLNGMTCCPDSGMLLGVEKECTFETGVRVLDGNDFSGKSPVQGCMVCVKYKVDLRPCPRDDSQLLDSAEDYVPVESHSSFEFELGTNAVVPQVDFCVSTMSVGQTARFFTASPRHGLLWAACEDIVDASGKAHASSLLRYTVELVSYQEPPEDRMECAHFSPRLSKQRLDFAMNLIRSRRAKSLLDLGCGSGSLLEVLVEQPSPLLRILGVDVSIKSLLRGAKTLHSKLGKQQDSGVGNLEALTLFQGSIAEFDFRLQRIDMATCIEVVEHLDPEPLAKFGEIVLGRMEPEALLVSTPNIEYNPILQGLSWDAVTEVDDIKLRNDDHRFEWTRSQFRTWADGLASKYGYEVEYSGVGGSGEEEGPGFASQIALFIRSRDVSKQTPDTVDELPYREVYSWIGKKTV